MSIRKRLTKSVTAKREFPTLFFKYSDLATLSGLATGANSDEFARVTAGTDSDINNNRVPPVNPPSNGSLYRNYGDRLFNAAFAAKFTSSEEERARYYAFCTSSVENLSGYTDWGTTAQEREGLQASHILAGMSVFVDLFYDSLDPAYRQDIFDRIDTQLDIHEQVILTDGREWVYGKTGNTNQVWWWSFLLGSLVQFAHTQDNKYRNFILSSIANTNEIFEIRGGEETASNTEGLFYTSYSMHCLLQTIDVLQNIELASLDYDNHSWLQGINDMYFYTYLPGNYNIVGYGDQNGVVGRGPQHILAYLSKINSGGRAAEIEYLRQSLWVNPSVNQSGNPNTGILCLDWLWRDASITSSVPSLSSVHNFTDWGVGVYKTDMSATSATYLSFKAANPAGARAWQLWRDGDPLMRTPNISHEMSDQGTFVYQPSGIRFIDGALYNLYKKTSIGNAITFNTSSTLGFKYTNAQIATVWDLSAIDELAESRQDINQAGTWANFTVENEMISSNLVNGYVSATLTPMSGGVGENVFVAGEYHQWYPSSVNLSAGGTYETELSSVYRTLLKFPNDVLCIVDHIDIGPTKSLAPRAYFHANSDSSFRATISDGGESSNSFSAVFTNPTGPFSNTLFCASGPVTPSGLTVSRSVTDYEEVPGSYPKSVDKAGGWDALQVYQWYARFEYGNLLGMNQMIYAAVPYDKTARVHTISNTNESVSFTVECSDGNTYAVQIASKDDPTTRTNVFGNSSTYYTVT
jgi:hypothetical protein